MMETEVQQSTPKALSLRVEIDAGEPIEGSVIVDGLVEPIAFSGWVELMAAINGARADHII